MQAIETVTGGRAGADWWSLGQREITQAIYDEIRRLDRESLANRFEDLAANTDNLGDRAVNRGNRRVADRANASPDRSLRLPRGHRLPSRTVQPRALIVEPMVTAHFAEGRRTDGRAKGLVGRTAAGGQPDRRGCSQDRRVVDLPMVPQWQMPGRSVTVSRRRQT